MTCVRYARDDTLEGQSHEYNVLLSKLSFAAIRGTPLHSYTVVQLLQRRITELLIVFPLPTRGNKRH